MKINGKILLILFAMIFSFSACNKDREAETKEYLEKRKSIEALNKHNNNENEKENDTEVVEPVDNNKDPEVNEEKPEGNNKDPGNEDRTIDRENFDKLLEDNEVKDSKFDKLEALYKISDKVYKLPATYGAFIKDPAIDIKLSVQEMQAKSYGNLKGKITAEDEGEKKSLLLNVSVDNFRNETIDINKASIYYMSIEIDEKVPFTKFHRNLVKLPEEVSLGMGVKDFEEAYGDPKEVKEEGQTTIYLYEIERSEQAVDQFIFSFKEDPEVGLYLYKVEFNLSDFEEKNIIE